MKTAVIYSGQARTFAQVFPNQWFHVLRKLPNPEFFVSVADDAQAPDMYRLLERFPGEKVHVEFVTQPDPVCPPADPKYLAVYPPSSSPESILKMFWSMTRAWEFAENQAGGLETFDIIVRMRCDLAFTRFELPGIVRNHRWKEGHHCFTPWWGRYGGENDRVAVMNFDAAKAYFSVYPNRHRLHQDGCPLHPETMLATTLAQYGVQPSATLATEFIAVRLDGTTVPCAISAIDYAEYARR